MMRHRGFLSPGFSSRLNLVVDLLWLFGALALSLWGRMVPSLFTFVSVGFALVFVWLFGSIFLRYYDSAADRALLDDLALLSLLSLCCTVFLLVLDSLMRDESAFPHVLPFTFIYWPVSLVICALIRRVVAKREAPIDEVLIIGVGPMGRITSEDIQKRGRRHVVGFLYFRDESLLDNLKGAILGQASDLEAILQTVAVGEVYISGNTLRHGQEMQEAIRVCERFGLPFALPAYSFRLDRARPIAAKLLSDGYIHYISIVMKPVQMAFKRVYDIACSFLALVMLSPLLFTVALLVKLTSRGPIFFKQVRVGFQGKKFNMLKFRSMVIDAEALKASLAHMNEQTGPVFKMKNDPRVTAIGRFIRRYSIDELPQLINVLRGDMSIVGPRPPVPPEVAEYESWQRRRLSVRPGLTCLWQVSGRNQISFEEWMYLDMQYIDHWSLKNDINLILKTIPVVLTGKGAS
ncbi:MAG: sugar transferase [Proteobacteria bacterium]|nr:sugar transferase [Cystobacterineae bacterium]MCL2258395.1 sugar transferase [Cystobacterineae bacterium]MCL2315093.1 sugar transferase [Pseudomonadota bacterium]